MRRPLSLILVLVALASVAVPAAATAQSNPFGPLPQSAPEATPVPTATPADQNSVSRPFLLGIAAAVAIIFLAIGFYITRDARRHLTDDDRRALESGRGREREPEGLPGERVRTRTAKSKARAAAKRQRQARKAQRRR
jgi:hypothetical protein